MAYTLAAAESPVPGAVGGLPPGVACQEAMMGTTAGQGATAETTSRRNQKTNDKDTDREGKPTLDGNGWLAASLAYHNRPREGQPLPAHWRTG